MLRHKSLLISKMLLNLTFHIWLWNEFEIVNKSSRIMKNATILQNIMQIAMMTCHADEQLYPTFTSLINQKMHFYWIVQKTVMNTFLQLYMHLIFQLVGYLMRDRYTDNLQKWHYMINWLLILYLSVAKLLPDNLMRVIP